MKKNNFLIVLTDQQRFDTIAAAGHPYMQTPNLDRLVNEGCLFKNAYSPNPICIPARHCLITGMTPRFHGYYGNFDQPIADSGIPTLARVMSENGWHTAALGKSHFVPPTEHHGYDELMLMEELPEDVEDDEYLKFLRKQGYENLRNIHGVRTMIYHEPQISLVPDECHGTTWLGNYASDWIKRNQHRPWLLTLGWIKPHPPWNIPESQIDRYKDADLPEPFTDAICPPFPQDALNNGLEDSDEEKRKIREAYFTSVSMVDDAFGVVMKTLEETDLLDDTFIIFTSDHGEMLQDRGMYQKSVPYESSARVPFVIRYPKRFKPGSTDERFIDLMDIFPTILDEAGIDYYYKKSHENYSLVGGSLLPETSNPGTRSREIQCSECLHERYRWVMSRDKRYKFIHYYRGGHEYLYDLENDPGEANNLIGTDKCPQKILTKLRNAAIDYEKNLGEPGRIENDNFKKCVVNEPGEEQDMYPVFDWNNGNKYPKWCFSAFQNFGRESKETEADIILDELEKSVSHRGGRKMLKAVKCQPGSKEMMCRAFSEIEEKRKAMENLIMS